MRSNDSMKHAALLPHTDDERGYSHLLFNGERLLLAVILLGEFSDLIFHSQLFLRLCISGGLHGGKGEERHKAMKQ